METVLEKRRFTRKTLAEPTQVLDQETGQLIGVLEDVSKEGFSLLTEQAVPQKEVRHITLVLPAPQESHHKVSLVAQCIWCRDGNKQDDHGKDNIEKNYAVGFQLQEISEQDAVALNYFIRDY